MSSYSYKHSGGNETGSDRDNGGFYDRKREGGWSSSGGWRGSYRPRYHHNAYRRWGGNHHHRNRFNRMVDEPVELVRRDPLGRRERETTRVLINVSTGPSGGSSSTTPTDIVDNGPSGGSLSTCYHYGGDLNVTSTYYSQATPPPLPFEGKRIRVAPPLPPPPSSSRSSSFEREPTSFSNLHPHQKKLVENCIANFKARGDYDEIRRACMLDVDTKPAFLNVMEKVKDITNRFLLTAQFSPHMDKAKSRENLKKSFDLSKTFQNGVESLINQILMPKVSTMLRPMVETEICKSLGLVDTEGQGDQQADTGKTGVETGQATPAPPSSVLPPMKIIMDSPPEEDLTKASKSPPKFIFSFKPAAVEFEVPLPSALVDEQMNLETIQEEILKELGQEEGEPQLEESVKKDNDEKENMIIIQNPTEEMSTKEPLALENAEEDGSKETELFEDEPKGQMEETFVPEKVFAVGNQVMDEKEVETEEESESPKEKVVDDEGTEAVEKLDKEESEETMVGYEVVDEAGSSDLEESESDEESPAFEKIEEVSPVHVPVYSPVYLPITNQDLSAEEEGEQMKDYATSLEDKDENAEVTQQEGKIGEIETMEPGTNVSGSNAVLVEKSQQEEDEDLCKFFAEDDTDKMFLENKMAWFKLIKKLDLDQGKTRFIPKKQAMKR